jgi:hypothetical protein
MLGLADGLGVLRAGAVQMSAKMEATLDLFVEQTVGAVLGMAIMMAFEVAREAGIPGEALVLEMYMSGEMEAVFQAFRETGFFRASEDHGPTAVFGGITRSRGDGGSLPASPRGHQERGLRPPLPGRSPERLPDARVRPGHDARRLADERGGEPHPAPHLARRGRPGARRRRLSFAPRALTVRPAQG